jgi:hypothetical protein
LETPRQRRRRHDAGADLVRNEQGHAAIVGEPAQQRRALRVPARQRRIRLRFIEIGQQRIRKPQRQAIDQQNRRRLRAQRRGQISRRFDCLP